MSHSNPSLGNASIHTCGFIFIFIMFSCISGCGPNHAIELIPGTESVDYNRGHDVFTMSPDEQWLFFWGNTTEYESTGEDGAENSNNRLYSLDLKTYKKTLHRIDNLPEKAISDQFSSKWAEVAIMFNAACWNDGWCYVDLASRFGSRDIRFRPGVAEAEIASLPKHRICSDCPPAGVDNKRAIELVGRAEIESFGHYTIAYREDVLGNWVYFSVQESGASVVYRIGIDGTREEVLRRSKKHKKTSITGLRIAPNERYLAYVLYSKLSSPIPLPDMKDEIFVRDLTTGEEKKVDDYRMTGNLLWSSDSKRLYLAGIGRNAGVYRVNVTLLFDN